MTKLRQLIPLFFNRREAFIEVKDESIAISGVSDVFQEVRDHDGLGL